MRRSAPPVVRLALVVVLVALLGACSDGGSDDRADDPPRTSTTVTSTTSAATAPTAPVDVGPTGQAYVDTLADALATGAAGGLPVDADAARCLAPRWVDTLGEDRLVDAGVTPEELASGYGADASEALDEIIDDDAAKAMVAAFGACDVDVEQVFVDALAAGRDLPQEQQACLRDALPDGAVEKAFTISLSEGQAALEADVELSDSLTNAVSSCAS